MFLLWLIHKTFYSSTSVILGQTVWAQERRVPKNLGALGQHPLQWGMADTLENAPCPHMFNYHAEFSSSKSNRVNMNRRRRRRRRF